MKSEKYWKNAERERTEALKIEDEFVIINWRLKLNEFLKRSVYNIIKVLFVTLKYDRSMKNSSNGINDRLDHYKIVLTLVPRFLSPFLFPRYKEPCTERNNKKIKNDIEKSVGDRE